MDVLSTYQLFWLELSAFFLPLNNGLKAIVGRSYYTIYYNPGKNMYILELIYVQLWQKWCNDFVFTYIEYNIWCNMSCQFI